MGVGSNPTGCLVYPVAVAELAYASGFSSLIHKARGVTEVEQEHTGWR